MKNGKKKDVGPRVMDPPPPPLPAAHLITRCSAAQGPRSHLQLGLRRLDPESSLRTPGQCSPSLPWRERPPPSLSFSLPHGLLSPAPSLHVAVIPRRVIRSIYVFPVRDEYPECPCIPLLLQPSVSIADAREIRRERTGEPHSLPASVEQSRAVQCMHPCAGRYQAKLPSVRGTEQPASPQPT